MKEESRGKAEGRRLKNLFLCHPPAGPQTARMILSVKSVKSVVQFFWPPVWPGWHGSSQSKSPGVLLTQLNMPGFGLQLLVPERLLSKTGGYSVDPVAVSRSQSQ
jgi:hypothetical protein